MSDTYKNGLKALLGIVFAFSVLFIPFNLMGLNINPVEVRVVALFVLAALFWVLEPVPIWTTSVLVIVLSLLLVSNQAPVFLQFDDHHQVYKNLVSSTAIMATFADPVVMLFLGGFFLAFAATKYHIDTSLAKTLLKPFGSNPRKVLLGMMMITAIFSMFMSNTATVAMMLAILAPVLSVFKENDKGKIGYALSIPLAANIGGIGTPIGTPPNAIALQKLHEYGFSIGFGKWMLFAVPFVLILIIFSWVVLIKIFPVKQQSIDVEMKSDYRRSSKTIIVYVTAVLTILLWVLGDSLLDMDANVVAMIPIAVFSLTQVITKDDLKKMSWDVLWLVSGGIALGLVLEKTGLANHLVGAVPFESWSPYALMVGTGLICIFMANFMSNTATANLLMPIIIVVVMDLGDKLQPLGGPMGLIISVALVDSLGMCLPISTPPNALAYSTGLISSKGMATMGLIIGIVGMCLVYAMMTFLGSIHYF